jgi:CHAT domain-containing protein/Tfp pilus assembly protein PilF
MRRAPALLFGIVLAMPWGGTQTSESDPHDAVQRLLDDGRFAEAQQAAHALLAVAERKPNPNPTVVAGILEPLVMAMFQNSECVTPECATLARRALQLRVAAGGEDDPAVASALVPLGITEVAAGAYDAALDDFRRAVALRQRVASRRDPLLIDALTQLGSLLSRTSAYPEARRALDRAVRTAEEQLGPYDPRLARALHRRAVLAFNESDLRAARTDIDRALQIRRRVLRPDHYDTAYGVGLLALVEHYSGDYATARRHYEESLDLLSRSYGADSPLLGSAHYNLGLFLMEIGDLAGALPHMRKSYEIIVSLVGPNHPDAAGTGHGELMMEMGDYAGARESLERSLRIRETYYGPDADGIGDGTLGLGELLLRMGDLEAARSLLERALSIFEKNHGAGSARAATALVPLGLALERRGQNAEAESVFGRAYENNAATLGPDHPHTAAALGHLARLRWKRGATGPAFDASLVAIGALRQSLVHTARALPERAALGYAVTLHAMFDLPCTLLAAGPRSGDAVSRLWDGIVRSRALVLDEMAARHRSALEHESSQVAALAERLAMARARLAHCVMVEDSGGSKTPYRARLAELIEAKDRAETALADRSAAFRDEIAARDIGLAGVLRALPRDAGLVSFVRYDDLASGPSYLALVHDAGAVRPALVPLGSAASIDEAVRRWRQEVSAPPRSPEDEARYRATAAALRRSIWDPLAPRLKRAALVLEVPDGALSLVNLATLPLDSGRYLVETDLRLQQLSAERDVVMPDAAGGSGRGILLVGAPDFQMAEGMVAATEIPPEAPVYRGLRSACGDFRSLSFAPLPGSGSEADEIAALWRERRSSAEPVMRLTGVEASEEAFKRLAPRRRILHIATHGFFVQDHCDSALDQAGEDWRPRSTRDVHAVATLENPLLLSGLAFAGANRREGSGDGTFGEDGILTAEEIASLDLRGVEWALLSACGSGIGPSQTGEGVLGLRRTFHVAGARTVLMSLYDVDDQTTRDWMRRLYDSRLRGRATVEAVRDASLALLAERRAAGVSTHPAFWGTFVAAGDWH